jgi:hypothetical protein
MLVGTGRSPSPDEIEQGREGPCPFRLRPLAACRTCVIAEDVKNPALRWQHFPGALTFTHIAYIFT